MPQTESVVATPEPGRTRALPPRQLASAAVGNLIEWFDWNAYAFLSVYFSAQFFPDDTPALVSLLGSFGILAIGFLVRPLAGLVIGRLADRLGRRFAMTLTVYGMGLGSLLIALSPTYDRIGVAAPLILLLARVIQGVCIGGEYGAVSAFAMEITPQGRRGFVAGILYAVGSVGQLLVTVLIVAATWTLSTESMQSWGWRVIFLISAALSFAGWWIRRGMVETARVSEHEPVRLFAALRERPGAAVRVVGMTMGFTVMVYAWGTYMPSYAMTYKGLDPKYGIVATMISFTVAGVCGLGAGLLSDRFGRRATLVGAGVVLAVGTVPAMGLLDGTLGSLILVQTLANAVIAVLQASAMPAYAELFPRRLRAGGLGFPYAITVGLIGGTAPLVGTQLAAWNLPHAFPWYLAGLMAISVVFYATMKETAFRPLPD